jgi:hypothetical protein
MKSGLLAVAFVLATSGFVAQGPVPDESGSHRTNQVQAADAADSLIVTNSNWLDVHIYLLRAGNYTPLGVVRSFATETLMLPSQATAPGSEVRLAADPIGGTGIYLSQPLMISDNATVVMNVENALSQSSTIVRRP